MTNRTGKVSVSASPEKFGKIIFISDIYIAQSKQRNTSIPF